MTNSKILLRIRPIEYFFFGGELTFGNDETLSYFAKSNMFPQQTTVLGLMRRILLDAQKPYGDSFDASKGNKQDFGAIAGLSPVFLLDDKGIGWLPHAMDAHPEELKCGIPIDSTDFYYSNTRGLGQAFTGLGATPGWKAAPYFEHADSKRDITDCLISEKGDTCTRAEVFNSFTRIGITKFRRGADPKTKIEAFYKQEMYKLSEGWSFAVVADLKNAADAGLFHNKTIVFGGEKCLARVEVSENSAAFEDRFTSKGMYKNRQAGQIVLLSDALVDEKILETCAAAVTDTNTFRNIMTPTKPKSYGPLKRTQSNEFLYKTGKLNLLRSGSVLFADKGDTKSITDLLDMGTHFQQIGYNHYLTF